MRARDAVGNATDSATRTVTVDTTKPDLFHLGTPSNGGCAMTPTPNLCWLQANDLGGIGGYQLWIDGALASSTTGPTTTCATPPSALSPGLHSWYAVAMDRVGNARQSTETFQVLIDYRPPTAPSLIAPANGTASPDPPMFAWAAATDAGGLARYQVFVDGGAVATVGADTLAWLPRTDFSVGQHSWYVVAIDECGQSTPSAAGAFTSAACTPDGMAHPCPGYNLGPCLPGTRTCDAPGVWSACAGAVSPSPEICNHQDDDCDGVVDQGANGCGGVCTLANNVSAPCDGDDADLCKEGIFVCSGLNDVKCVETTPVNVEVCNGRDDDCNGIVDDAPGCPHPDAGSGADAAPSMDGGDDGGGDDAPLFEDAGVAATGGRPGRQPHDAGIDAARPRSSSGCSCAAAPSDRGGAPLMGGGLVVALAVIASRKRR